MLLSIEPRRISGGIATVIALIAFSLCNHSVHAQGNAGGGTAEGTDGEGPLFQPTEPDLSVFDAVERGDSIGMSATQGFGLGAEAAGIGGARSAAGGGGFGGGGLGGLGGLFGGLGGAFGGQNNASTKPILRVRLKSAVAVAPRSAAEVQRSAARTLSRTPINSSVSGVNVSMDGRTAVLNGAVQSEKHRRMSELLMRLEPGVDRVVNQVVVGN